MSDVLGLIPLSSLSKPLACLGVPPAHRRVYTTAAPIFEHPFSRHNRVPSSLHARAPRSDGGGRSLTRHMSVLHPRHAAAAASAALPFPNLLFPGFLARARRVCPDATTQQASDHAISVLHVRGLLARACNAHNTTQQPFFFTSACSLPAPEAITTTRNNRPSSRPRAPCPRPRPGRRRSCARRRHPASRATATGAQATPQKPRRRRCRCHRRLRRGRRGKRPRRTRRRLHPRPVGRVEWVMVVVDGKWVVVVVGDCGQGWYWYVLCDGSGGGAADGGGFTSSAS